MWNSVFSAFALALIITGCANTSTPEKNHQEASDLVVCLNSTVVKNNGSYEWSNVSANEAFVRLSMARNFTPASCIALIEQVRSSNSDFDSCNIAVSVSSEGVYRWAKNWPNSLFAKKAKEEGFTLDRCYRVLRGD